jgi:tetratricopeptide (TPR) repeat protein
MDTAPDTNAAVEPATHVAGHVYRAADRWSWVAWVIPPAVVFLASACIMTVELDAGRLIARFLGQSLYTWTSVIGVVLSGIALGNYFGGRLADAFEARKTLAALLILASITCVFVPPLNNAVGDWEALWFQSWPTRIALHVFLVFTIPTIAMGTISPVCAKLALDQGRQTGRTVGNIYAWGALGSVLGTFAAGFYLIPALTSTQVVWVVSPVLAVMGLLFALRSWWTYAWIGGYAVLAYGALGSGQTAKAIGTGLLLRQPENPSVIYDAESQYSHIRVVEIPQIRQRQLLLDRLLHSIVNIDRPTRLNYGYERIYAAVTKCNRPQDRPLRTLMFGGGGFVFPRYLELTYPASDNTVVEIDPLVTKVAFEEFMLPRNTRIKIVTADARNYVQSLIDAKRRGEPVEPFDFIYADAFSHYNVPFHLTTQEFVRAVDDLLRDDGVYAQNLIDTYASAKFLGAMYNTLHSVFQHVVVIGTLLDGPSLDPKMRDTFVLLASQQPLTVDLAQCDPDVSDFPRLDDAQIAHIEQQSAGMILTDDYAPIENLLAEVVKTTSSPIQELVTRGLSARIGGDYETAIWCFQRALELDDRNAEMHADYAAALLARGQSEDLLTAAYHYRRALASEPDAFSWRNDYGVVLSRLGRAGEAEEQFRAVIEANPNCGPCYANLGNVLLATGRADDAVAAYRRALELQPGHRTATESLGKALVAAGRYDEAIDELREVQKHHPTPEIFDADLANALVLTGRYDEAAVVLKRLAAADPKAPLVADALSWILAVAGSDAVHDPKAAIQYAEHANKLTQYTQPMFLGTLAAAYAADDQYDNALEAINRALQLCAAQHVADDVVHQLEARRDAYQQHRRDVDLSMGGSLPTSAPAGAAP